VIFANDWKKIKITTGKKWGPKIKISKKTI
jgi:hypothetical protein